MSTEADDTARTAALKFADALASSFRAQLGERVIGTYLIGSLAHGGFSRRYSDIDIALITEVALDAATLTALRGLAEELDAALTLKLSLFWADRHFAVGRFPPLDRADYLDHAIVLTERERLLPARPTLDEIRTYLGGAPFSSWTENAQRFAAMDVLTPARLVYSWTTGQMASNDEAVAFTCEHRPPGLDTDLLTRALAYRQAAADPDALFPARAVLLDQVRSCTQFLTDSTS